MSQVMCEKSYPTCADHTRGYNSPVKYNYPCLFLISHSIKLSFECVCPKVGRANIWKLDVADRPFESNEFFL